MPGKDDAPVGEETLEDMKLRVTGLLLDKMEKMSAKMNKESHLEKNYTFWKTQPVEQFGEPVASEEDVGPIEPDVPIDRVRQTPYKLPEGFEWSTLDISNEEEVGELFKLLTHNYVEDDDAMFRFDYSPDFLRWALLIPEYRKDWHLCVRVKSNRKLVGFISGIPASISTFGKVTKMVEINYLCVIKKLRTKRLAPVLIKEITRRVNLAGIFQATYTSGTMLPKPTTQIRYYHRALNLKKLVDINFSRIPPKRTLQKQLQILELPTEVQTPGFRALQKGDCAVACAKLNEYLQQFKCHPVFTVAEFEHFFLTRNKVIYGYVVEDPESKEITDFISYYIIPSKVLKSPKYTEMTAAFMYYSYHTKTDYVALVRDALITASKDGVDVYNALAMQQHTKFIKPLLFGEGDGDLKYYFYNFRCPSIEGSEEGIILL